MFLNNSEENLRELGVFHTRTEIAQQPRLWNEVYKMINNQKEAISTFFECITSIHPRIKVILTGAGTSAFIGNVVQPHLNKVCDKQVFTIQSIPTTNIVSNPSHYLDAETPTVMVSFARSGNSPESVAAVELGEKLVNDFYQIHITCNKEGHLGKRAENRKDILLLLMPEETNDQSFAMTSSFTCMMLAVLLVFQLDLLNGLESTISSISSHGMNILIQASERIKEVANLTFTNIVYLGSGPLLGLAHEASLKMLELTDGDVFTYYESPLGLRHGPKTIINDETLAFVFISNDPYTQKYDIDIVKELFNEKQRTTIKVMAVSYHYIKTVDENSDFYFYQNKVETAGSKYIDDVWLALPFILYAQMLAVFKSLNLELLPDNPVPNGSVNRVVQGVTIYPFE